MASMKMCEQSVWVNKTRIPYGSPSERQEHKSRSHELSIQGFCMMWGIRVIIPQKFRKNILEEVHQGHLGIVKMKSIARSYVRWPCKIRSRYRGYGQDVWRLPGGTKGTCIGSTSSLGMASGTLETGAYRLCWPIPQLYVSGGGGCTFKVAGDFQDEKYHCPKHYLFYEHCLLGHPLRERKQRKV